LSGGPAPGDHGVIMARRLRSIALALPLALSALAASAVAEGFCGFYVAGADKKLFNNATMVVLMREGTRTVLSMQNNYQGPPENFAMVVPVPIVLQRNMGIDRHPGGSNR
jgi:hypothetical protein